MAPTCLYNFEEIVALLNAICLNLINYPRTVFLLGAFLGKSARLLQLLVFFAILQSHSDWATKLLNYYHKAKSGQRKLVQRGLPFHFLLF